MNAKDEKDFEEKAGTENKKETNSPDLKEEQKESQNPDMPLPHDEGEYGLGALLDNEEALEEARKSSQYHMSHDLLEHSQDRFGK